MNAQRAALVLSALAGALAAAGCADDEPRLESATVSGQVTLAGRPLPDGEILFIPDNGLRGPAGVGVIRNGRYQLQAYDGFAGAVVGPNRVRVQRFVTRADGTVDQVIAAKYNERTTLRCDVPRSGSRRADFRLK